jgi:hypothetical protein
MSGRLIPPKSVVCGFGIQGLQARLETVGGSRHEVVGGVDDVHPSRNGQERIGRSVTSEMEDEEEDF